MTMAADPQAPSRPGSAPWIERQAVQILQARSHHAWLLQGPSGLGQIDLAFVLAASWLCESAQASSPLACGHCASCNAIRARAHPDLRVLLPELMLIDRDWPLSDKAQTEIDQKKRKPSREIRVDAMRDAIEFTQRTSARGRGLVVVVAPAERMNAITANALLKTLEEPPGNTRFVLASDAPHALLPTVRSRCRSHAMQWPAQDESEAWLGGHPQWPGGDPAVWMRAAGGRPGDALELATAGAKLEWKALPRSIAAGNAMLPLGQLPAALLVSILQKVCHDLLARAVGAAPRFFEAADLPSTRPPLLALVRWAQALEREARTAEHPYLAALTVEALVSQARMTLNSAVAPVVRGNP